MRGYDAASTNEILARAGLTRDGWQYDTVLRASVRLTVEQSSFSCSAQTPYNMAITVIEDLLRQAGEQGELLLGTDPGEEAVAAPA